MDSIIDLIWSVEENDSETNGDIIIINANCGGNPGGCGSGPGTPIACCCSVPSFFTKWICN